MWQDERRISKRQKRSQHCAEPKCARAGNLCLIQSHPGTFKGGKADLWQLAELVSRLVSLFFGQLCAAEPCPRSDTPNPRWGELRVGIVLSYKAREHLEHCVFTQPGMRSLLISLSPWHCRLCAFVLFLLLFCSSLESGSFPGHRPSPTMLLWQLPLHGQIPHPPFTPTS